MVFDHALATTAEHVVCTANTYSESAAVGYTSGQTIIEKYAKISKHDTIKSYNFPRCMVVFSYALATIAQHVVCTVNTHSG